MTEKCCYCDNPIKGYHCQGWFYFHRLPSSFKNIMASIPDNITPGSFAPIREKICRGCFKLIQHDSRRERSYNPDIEIYDTQNL